MDKIEDFGVHMDAYYPLKVEIFKTKLDEQLLDLLWNKYWVATLSQSLIVSVRQIRRTCSLAEQQNREYATSQVKDLGMKIKSATDSMQSGPPGCALKVVASTEGKSKQSSVYEIEDEETALSKVARDR